ncbi:hypothetical protein [Caldiplasma sukawensis]
MDCFNNLGEGVKLTRKLLELMGILGIKPEEVSDSIVRDEDDSIIFNRNFDKRLRLQKVVFLIEHKTKDFNYPFSLYLRGPYSKELAKEYYSINDYAYSESDELMSEEGKGLAKNLSEKDNLWLEIASTIVMFSHSYKIEDAVKRTKEFKSSVLSNLNKPEDYVDSVYEEIREMNLL